MSNRVMKLLTLILDTKDSFIGIESSIETLHKLFESDIDFKDMSLAMSIFYMFSDHDKYHQNVKQVHTSTEDEYNLNKNNIFLISSNEGYVFILITNDHIFLIDDRYGTYSMDYNEILRVFNDLLGNTVYHTKFSGYPDISKYMKLLYVNLYEYGQDINLRDVNKMNKFFNYLRRD